MPYEKLSPGALAGATGALITVYGIDETEDSITLAEAKARPKTRQELWRERNPLKYWAHEATRSALSRGLLVKPDRCDCRGTPGAVEAHRPDHRSSLCVVWLLRVCHKRLHASERRRVG